MQKSKLSETQIVGILKDAESGMWNLLSKPVVEKQLKVSRKALRSCQNLSPSVSFRGTRRTPLCQLDTHAHKTVVSRRSVLCASDRMPQLDRPRRDLSQAPSDRRGLVMSIVLCADGSQSGSTMLCDNRLGTDTIHGEC